MTRSLWKNFYVHPSLLKLSNKISTIKKEDLFSLTNNSGFEIWSRNTTILQEFVGLEFEIYNGQKFVPVVLKTNMSYKKLGEFVFTKKRGPSIHVIKKKKKKTK